MAQPRAVANNRKLPRLPRLADLDREDRRRWAVVFTNARLQKRWTYTRLSAASGVDLCTTVLACTRGHCNSLTLLRLLDALGMALPQLRIVSAYEAHHGHAKADHHEAAHG